MDPLLAFDGRCVFLIVFDLVGFGLCDWIVWTLFSFVSWCLSQTNCLSPP
jgi:hypothetical protein